MGRLEVDVVIEMARPGGRVRCVSWKFYGGLGNMWEGEGLRCGMRGNVWWYMCCIV